MTRRAVKVAAPALRLDPERILKSVDWTRMFGSGEPVEVEVGIGKGRFLLAAAEARPEIHHFGVEWANKYLRIAESRALRRGLTNVRFARVDARELIEGPVPDSSVAAYYVFYPDPWPKKRHHKRRFIQTRTADHLARTLIDGGKLHVATDHEEYWEAIQEVLDAHPAFRRLARFGDEAFPVSIDEPLTNFEAKYRIEGRKRLRGSWQRTDR